MSGSESARNRETESQAPQALSHLLEGLKDPGYLRRLEADARVGDRDRDPAGSRLGLEQEDAASPRRELDRVLDEVPEDLAQPRRVGVDVLPGSRPISLHRDPFFIGLRAANVEDVVQRLAELDGLVLELDLAPGDPRQVQEIVDQPRFDLGVSPDHLDLSPGVGRQRGAPLQGRAQGEDRSQRRAQLVR